MANPPLNFTWSKMQPISIEWYQVQPFLMLYASFKSIQITKTATDWNAHKVGDSSKKTQHDLYHPTGNAQTFNHAKFELGLSI
ncbi:hypothetical protein [Absidia glauca]|uniref:Ndc10 domain-containing protein n=1 Tax=Absidia glauca TaxID=4829 RepID=A0A163MSZ7_ABSGL|nr:hypothetical protein [Absidia glauca]